MSEIEALRSAKEQGFIKARVIFSDEYFGIHNVINDVEMDLKDSKLDHMDDHEFKVIGNIISKSLYGISTTIYELK